MTVKCSANSCDRDAKARGLCFLHYSRERRRGAFTPAAKTHETLAAFFWQRVNKDGPTSPGMTTPCWEWTGATNGRGYGDVWFQGTRVGQAHRVAWHLAHPGQTPARPNILHRCDNPRCVRAGSDGKGHLFLGTNADNTADMIAKGRAIWQRKGGATRRWRHNVAAAAKGRRGVPGANARLTSAMVAEARRRRAQGEKLAALASAYGVTESAMSRIVNGLTYNYVR